MVASRRSRKTNATNAEVVTDSIHNENVGGSTEFYNGKRKVATPGGSSLTNHFSLQEYDNNVDKDSFVQKGYSMSNQGPVISETNNGSVHTKTTVNDFKEYVPDDNHILEMQTLAGNTFKNLLETLKAVLNDANIVFTERGFKLAAVDTNKHALVHLLMDAGSFQFYHLKVEKLKLGIDIETLHRSIKTNKSNDLMCFVVKKDDPEYLEISYENFAKGTRVTDKIKLLCLREYKIMDEIEYKMPPEMDSFMFQNICKEMATFQATLLEIKSVGDKLIFSNLDGNNIRKVTVRVGTSDETIDFKAGTRHMTNLQSRLEGSPGEDARGVFLLKFLKSFAKAATLSPKVKIYLKNGCPLILEYSVAGLGTLKYVLSSEDDVDM